MKKILLLSGICICTYFFESCRNANQPSTVTDSTANKPSTDSAQVNVPDTSRKDAESTKLATQAAEGGMLEVALAKIAAEKANSKRIKEFAKMMVSDHTKANDNLKQKAAAQKIELPANISSSDQKIIDHLSEKTGKDFDSTYMNMMLEDHRRTIDLFTQEAANGINASIKDFAATTLPIIQNHLMEAQSITGKK